MSWWVLVEFKEDEARACEFSEFSHLRWERWRKRGWVSDFRLPYGGDPVWHRWFCDRNGVSILVIGEDLSSYKVAIMAATGASLVWKMTYSGMVLWQHTEFHTCVTHILIQTVDFYGPTLPKQIVCIVFIAEHSHLTHPSLIICPEHEKKT